MANSKTNKTPDPDTKTTAAPRYAGITSFVYAGPSLPGGKLKNNTVLSGAYDEITSYYKDALEEYPGAAKLIVPVAKLAETRAKVETTGNIANQYYNDIVAAINSKREE